MKIRSLGAELFHGDGETVRRKEIHDKSNSHFSQFCERDYNGSS
jgi:hypothetical protein